ncbi:hypothetical protein [Laspinema olomoucense]|uniref:hypothetical protein n=1 Tax=Laspinema olomoucense TaxID=3231600 RepID=UPI0021BABD48|nr:MULTISPECIES: hypothetical protein [unclassified Laspinema]MCT7973694.1 hypothetical protein [Laspinema sp. D3d]MCT7996606.1 hypothetical protein [Laspinema sp. D3c]
MNKRLLLITLPISYFLIGVTSSIVAIARPFESIPLKCLFFRNGQLELTQNCSSSGASWAGGGFRVLQWDDGTTTRIAFGLQGRGERPCPQLSVNNICGEFGYRDAITLQPLSDAELQGKRQNNLPVVQCANVNNDSICWRSH